MSHLNYSERMANMANGRATFKLYPYGVFQNDGLLADEPAAVAAEQRALSTAPRGKRSKRALKAKRAMAKRHRRIANRRKDRNHQITSRLVRDHKLIVTEELAVWNMTASAKGRGEKPGKNVKVKAGLNRAFLNATPGSFLNMLATQAQQAGCELVVLDTRKERSSPTRPCCGAVRKKAPWERQHRCGCGFMATRDQASALAMLGAGLRLAGREPAWTRVTAPETLHKSRVAA
jgi:putative transposase